MDVMAWPSGLKASAARCSLTWSENPCEGNGTGRKWYWNVGRGMVCVGVVVTQPKFVSAASTPVHTRALSTLTGHKSLLIQVTMLMAT